MNDPRRVLLEYLLAFPDPETASSLFAEDGVFEMPYLVSVGLEPRAVGPEQIRGFISKVVELYPDFTFDADEVTVLIDTPTQAFAEYITHPTSAATGRKVHHLLMGRIVVENGKIKLLHEALNTVATAQTLLPGGAADLPAPGMEIRPF
jgi:hypothetical protein